MAKRKKMVHESKAHEKKEMDMMKRIEKKDEKAHGKIMKKIGKKC